MNNRDSILTTLRTATGWTTGESLAERLDISRMAVSKQVSALNAMGYTIESAHRKGYHFLSAPDLLLPEEVRFNLQTTTFGQRDIHYFSEIDSTNSAAKEAALAGCAEGTLFIAEHQTAGRGRRGRSWFSGRSQGLCFTLVLHPVFSPRHLTLLPLLTAVAVSEAIEEITGLRAEVKWPNDLLIGGKKTCGILTEAGFDLESIDYAVIGIGLNINTPREVIPSELQSIATSLAIEAGHPIDRPALTRALLQHFEQRYEQAWTEGFDAMLNTWRERSCTLGRTVTVKQESGNVQGVAEALTAEGALLLRRPDGVLQTMLSGDVAL